MRACLAALCLFAAACGKTTNLTDAPRGDGAGADAANTIDADAHGAVTVVVLELGGAGQPIAGQLVVFMEPDGTLEPVQTTGSDGTAMYSVLPGSTVFTAYGTATQNMRVEMVRGVKPGDTITIGGAKGGSAGSGFTVNITPVAFSQSYDIYGPCGSVNVPDPGSGATTAAGTIPMSTDCQQANMDLVAVLNNNDGIPASYVEQAGVPYVANGSATMPSTWIPLQQDTATYNNLPAGTNVTSFELHVPDASGYSDVRQIGFGSGTATMSIATPVAQTALEVDLVSGSSGTRTIYQQVAGTPDTYTIDWSTETLPAIGIPTLDTATGTITAPFTGTGGGDVYNLQVEYNRPDPSVEGFDYILWDVWMPAPADLTLPTVADAGFANVNLQSTDSVDYQTASFYDADAVTSYDQIRGNLFSAFDAYYAGRGITGALHVSDSNMLGIAVRGPQRPRAIHNWHY